MSTQTITLGVAGMTCGHCVRSVTEELRSLACVTDVQVELVSGATSTVTITSELALADADVAAAIVEAGYAVVPPRSLL